jgi:hypothetical protein
VWNSRDYVRIPEKQAVAEFYILYSRVCAHYTRTIVSKESVLLGLSLKILLNQF